MRFSRPFWGHFGTLQHTVFARRKHLFILSPQALQTQKDNLLNLCACAAILAKPRGTTKLFSNLTVLLCQTWLASHPPSM